VTCEEAEGAVLAELRNSSEGRGEGGESIDGRCNGEVSDTDTAKTRKIDPKRTRERCRQAARRLAARGEIVVLQDRERVDPSFAKGVMELKFPS
jgi:hypothetical protein